MSWSLETSNGFESRKIKYLLPKYTRGRVLEIGCGQEKAYPHFIGYDSGHHFGQGAADVMGDAGDLALFADNSLDAVFSSHVLEHMVDMGQALAEWGRVIKPGGYIFMIVPHKERTFDNTRERTTLAELITRHQEGFDSVDYGHFSVHHVYD